MVECVKVRVKGRGVKRCSTMWVVSSRARSIVEHVNSISKTALEEFGRAPDRCHRSHF